MAEADTIDTDILTPSIIPDTNTDGTPKGIEIDIDTGEVVDSTTPGDAPPPAPPTPRKPRSQVRIQELSGEKQRLEQELAQARAEATDAARRADEATVAREAAERSGMENYGARVKGDVAAAQAELAGALATNDAQAVVMAQTKLAKAAAQESDYDTWAQSHPKQEPQQRQPQQRQQPQQQQPQQRQPQQQTPQVSESVVNFMLENTWFTPYQIDDSGQLVLNNGQPVENPDFDPEMRDAALLRDAQIKREIRLGRKPQSYMESDDYYNDLRSTVTQTFPDAFEDTPPPPPPQRARAPQMQPSRQAVPPVQRQAMPGQNPPKPGNRVQLSGEERSLVDSLVDNKSMRYPKQHPDADKRGQVMSKQDAYVQYARERAKQ